MFVVVSLELYRHISVDVFLQMKKAKDIAFRYIDCMIQSIAYVWLYHFMCLNV